LAHLMLRLEVSDSDVVLLALQLGLLILITTALHHELSHGFAEVRVETKAYGD
jgi:hypothetical protein